MASKNPIKKVQQ